MPTTEATRDFLGRRLQNANPGVSTALDYMGRGIMPADKDYLGRGLVEEPGSISGTVTADADDSPIEDATVSVGGGNDTQTDENGDYTLTVDEGTYTVTVAADGYIGDDQAGVVVNSEQAITGIDFSLVLDD